MIQYDNLSFEFKKISDDNMPLLYNWFKEYHVQQWWPTPEENEFYEHFLKRIRSKDCFGFLALLDGIPIGYLQYYYINRNNEKTGSWLPELPAATVGTDQFIGDPIYLGKGYGTEMIRAFIKYLQIIEPTGTTIIVDPDPTNQAAIRCYEKVGFEEMGIYDSPWGPALLMKYEIPNKYHT